MYSEWKDIWLSISTTRVRTEVIQPAIDEQIATIPENILNKIKKITKCLKCKVFIALFPDKSKMSAILMALWKQRSNEC